MASIDPERVQRVAALLRELASDCWDFADNRTWDQGVSPSHDVIVQGYWNGKGDGFQVASSYVVALLKEEESNGGRTAT
jgi:hypothetical protein